MQTLPIEETDLQKLKRIAQNKGQSIQKVLHDWLNSQEDQPEGKKSVNSGATWGEQAMKEIEQLNISHETGKHILKTIQEFRDDEGV